jgi:hypothetical protein
MLAVGKQSQRDRNMGRKSLHTPGIWRAVGTPVCKKLIREAEKYNELSEIILPRDQPL